MLFREEDETILHRIIKCDLYRFLTSSSSVIWKSIAKAIGSKRSWTTVKDRFEKVILPNIDTYSLSSRIRSKFYLVRDGGKKNEQLLSMTDDGDDTELVESAPKPRKLVKHKKRKVQDDEDSSEDDTGANNRPHKKRRRKVTKVPADAYKFGGTSNGSSNSSPGVESYFNPGTEEIDEASKTIEALMDNSGIPDEILDEEELNGTEEHHRRSPMELGESLRVASGDNLDISRNEDNTRNGSLPSTVPGNLTMANLEHFDDDQFLDNNDRIFNSTPNDDQEEMIEETASASDPPAAVMDDGEPTQTPRARSSLETPRARPAPGFEVLADLNIPDRSVNNNSRRTPKNRRVPGDSNITVDSSHSQDDLELEEPVDQSFANYKSLPTAQIGVNGNNVYLVVSGLPTDIDVSSIKLVNTKSRRQDEDEDTNNDDSRTSGRGGKKKLTIINTEAPLNRKGSKRRKGTKEWRKDQSKFRTPYTVKEKRAMVEFLSRKDRKSQVGGNRVWQIMEQRRICPGRSWGSMRDYYLKHMKDEASEN